MSGGADRLKKLTENRKKTTKNILTSRGDKDFYTDGGGNILFWRQWWLWWDIIMIMRYNHDVDYDILSWLWLWYIIMTIRYDYNVDYEI